MKKNRRGAGEERQLVCAVLGFQTVQILKSILYIDFYTVNAPELWLLRIRLCGRTRETAQVLLDSLGREGEQPEVRTWLRERFFGSFELMDHKHYEDVWALDKNNDEHSEFGVEPAAAVRRRVLGKFKNSQKSMS